MSGQDLVGFYCHRCGEYHGEIPLAFGFDAPAYWEDIPVEEREARVVLEGDTCIIDDEHFFIIGNIELPIAGREENFTWSAWVSLSEANFDRAAELWEEPSRESEPPYFGWLSNQLPTYPDTLNLKTNVHSQAVGVRPLIDLEPTDHPLAVEQLEGISWEHVQEIAELSLHGTGGAESDDG